MDLSCETRTINIEKEYRILEIWIIVLEYYATRMHWFPPSSQLRYSVLKETFRIQSIKPTPTSEVGGSIPVTTLSGKAGSCLPLVGSLQYTTLANSMYWFPLPFQLPVVI